jgi:drug/metabolite transporter (DMT)-like permease
VAVVDRSRTTPAVGALFAVAAAMAAWGLSGVLAKKTAMPGMAVAAYRLCLGAVVVLPILYASGRRLTWRTLRISLLGGVFLGLDIVFFFTAVKETTVANATIIGALQPVIVMLLAPITGERVARRAQAWAAVGVVGTALVIFGASGLPEWSARGDGIAFLALAAWTSYFFATKRARGKLTTIEYTASTALIATFIATPIAALNGTDLSWPTWESWIYLAIMALVAGIGGHFLMSYAVPHLPLWLSSTMTLSIPVISTAAAALWLGESLAVMQAVGMAVVLVALGFAVLTPRAPEPTA